MEALPEDRFSSKRQSVPGSKFLREPSPHTWYVALCTTSLIHETQMMTTKQVRPHGGLRQLQFGAFRLDTHDRVIDRTGSPFAWVAERAKFSALCPSTLVKPWAKES